MTPAEPIVEAIKQLDNVELGKVRDEVLLEIDRRGELMVPASTISEVEGDDDWETDDDYDDDDDDWDGDDFWDDEDYDYEDE